MAFFITRVLSASQLLEKAWLLFEFKNLNWNLNFLSVFYLYSEALGHLKCRSSSQFCDLLVTWTAYHLCTWQSYSLIFLRSPMASNSSIWKQTNLFIAISIHEWVLYRTYVSHCNPYRGSYTSLKWVLWSCPSSLPSAMPIKTWAYGFQILCKATCSFYANTK